MPRKYLEKRDPVEDDKDAMGTTYRSLYFKEDAVDARDRAEKVKDQFVEAGKDTRNANQYVRLVNAHLQSKVTQVERAKEAQKKFEEEINMFSGGLSAFEEPQTRQAALNPDVENALIVREMLAMLNKYGVEKLSNALDQIISSQR